MVGLDGAKGDKGDTGEKGADGVGISNVTITTEGALNVSLTNGTNLNLGNIKGSDGIGITKSEINAGGELVLTYTDGKTANLGRVTGTDGTNGTDGRDGVGIKTVTLSSDGNLSMTMTDNTVYNLGNVKGEKGEKGDPGEKGDKGDKGEPGRGIADMEIVDGELIVYYTDGTEDNLGSIGSGEQTVDSRLVFTLLSDGTYSVTLDRDYVDMISGMISIPSEYNGMPVTVIEDSAFYNCKFLSTVKIPNSIKKIGGNAFYNCIALTNVVFTGEFSDLIIGSQAFRNCALQEISFPIGTVEIGSFVTSDCKNLNNVVIPEGIKTIGIGAFSQDINLHEITIPASVTYVGSGLINNSGITKVYFEDPAGWKRYRRNEYGDPTGLGSNVNESELNDATQAANYLNTYSTYVLTK